MSLNVVTSGEHPDDKDEERAGVGGPWIQTDFITVSLLQRELGLAFRILNLTL
jgi:hypothetical protein